MNENQILYTKRANLVMVCFAWIVLILAFFANLLSSELPMRQLMLIIGVAAVLVSILTILYIVKLPPSYVKWIAILSITLYSYYNLYAAYGQGTFRGFFLFFEALAMIALYLDKSAIQRFSLTVGTLNIILFIVAGKRFFNGVDLNSFFQFMVAFYGCTFLLYFITLWGEEMLQKSEERWQFALEGNGDGVWDWYIQTKEVFFSPQWKRMIGYAEKEIGHDYQEWESRIHPDDRDAVLAAVNQHLDGKTPYFVAEHRFQCKDGTYIWILARGKVMTRDRNNAPLRMICSHTDITQRKLAEAQLESLQIQLIQKEKIASLAHLTAGVAHEINSPLGAIKSNLGLTSMLLQMSEGTFNQPFDEEQLSQVRSLTAKMKKANSISTQATERIEGIIHTLERLSRLEDADWQVFDLNEGIENILSTIAEEYQGRMVIHTEYGSIPKVPCIPSQITQVVGNLISNRINACEDVLDLYLSTQVHEGFVTITVRDTGKGISKTQQSRIFDPAWTTRGNVIGMELGLAIAYNIVQNHRGELLFQSDEEQGSRFIVKLPV